MKIIIPTSGKQLQVPAEVGDSIFKLKAMITDELGVPPTFQEISYNGQIMKDALYLKDYGVDANSEVHEDGHSPNNNTYGRWSCCSSFVVE